MMLLGRSPASLLLGFKIDHTSFGVAGWLFTAAGVTEKEKKNLVMKIWQRSQESGPALVKYPFPFLPPCLTYVAGTEAGGTGPEHMA